MYVPAEVQEIDFGFAIRDDGVLLIWGDQTCVELSEADTSARAQRVRDAAEEYGTLMVRARRLELRVDEALNAYNRALENYGELRAGAVAINADVMPDEPSRADLDELEMLHESVLDAARRTATLAVDVVMAIKAEARMQELHQLESEGWQGTFQVLNDLLTDEADGAADARIRIEEAHEDNQETLEMVLEYIDEFVKVRGKLEYLELFLVWLEDNRHLIRGSGSVAKVTYMSLMKVYDEYMGTLPEESG